MTTGIQIIRDVQQLLAAWRRPLLPNVVRMTPEQYLELDRWCELEASRFRERDVGNPMDFQMLLGMHIQTHVGQLEIDRDEALALADWQRSHAAKTSQTDLSS